MFYSTPLFNGLQISRSDPFCLEMIRFEHVAFRALQGRRRPDCIFSELNTHPAYPLSTLRCAPRGTQRKTRGRADRYSFLVRNFHPLLHAGLSRRTVMGMFQQLTALH